jgi:hypothetical protein
MEDFAEMVGFYCKTHNRLQYLNCSTFGMLPQLNLCKNWCVAISFWQQVVEVQESLKEVQEKVSKRRFMCIKSALHGKTLHFSAINPGLSDKSHFTAHKWL